MSTGSELRRTAETAVVRGTAFIEREQLPSGELRLQTWQTRRATPPADDPAVFPTALIALLLEHVPETQRIRERAVAFVLAHEEPHGVWRHVTREHPDFHTLTPDVDDTAVASLALAKHGRRVPDNRALLLANRRSDGLFYTWITPRLRWVPNAAFWLVALRQLPDARRLRRYFTSTPARIDDVDAAVNANVLLYLGATDETRPVIEHLVKHLRDGSELSADRWYRNRFALWFFLSRALSRYAPEARDLLVARASSVPPANALEAAHALSILLDWGVEPDPEFVSAITGAQLDSGGWPTIALYETSAGGCWGSPTLTSAFALEALQRWGSRR